jgi:hypothetical protein
MKTVWIIQWTNGKNNTIDVYDEYTFAEKTYRREIERIKQRATLMDESKEWEFKEFKFRKSIFYHYSTLEILTLQQRIVREEKNYIK